MFFGGLCIFSCVSLISSFFGCAIACHGFASFDVFGGFAVHLTLSPLVINLLVVGEALCPHSPAPLLLFPHNNTSMLVQGGFALFFALLFQFFGEFGSCVLSWVRFGRGPF